MNIGIEIAPTSELIDKYIGVMKFTFTVTKWLSHQGEFDNFKILYFEDIVKDNKAVYKSVCDFLGLEANNLVFSQANSIGEVKELVEENGIPTINHIIEFSDEQVLTINQQIDELSEILNQDFSYWKR